jgi:hypothetical protein
MVPVKWGLYSHSIIGRSDSYFLGEHVMDENSNPACGAEGQIVSLPDLTLSAGFAIACRKCIATLAPQRRKGAR